MTDKREYQDILNRLRAIRRKDMFQAILSGLLYTTSIVLGVMLVLSMIEMAAHGDETFRAVLAIFLLLSFIIGAGYFVVPQLLTGLGFRSRPDEINLALRVGEHYPELRDRLANVLQLIGNLPDKNGTSEELTLAAFQRVKADADGKDFDVILDRKRIKSALLWFVLAAVIAIPVFMLWPQASDAMNRISNWDRSYLPPAPYTLKLNPMKDKVLRGSRVVISVIAEGKNFPDRIDLFVREDQQEEFDSFKLKQDSAGIYIYEIPSLRQSIEYYASSTWLSTEVKTETGKINVVDRPDIRSLTGRVTYPTYTRLAPRNLTEQTADISALKGSRVNLNVISNKELASAQIIIHYSNIADILDADSSGVDSLAIAKHDSSVIDMKISGHTADGGFTVSRSGTYYISLTDKSGEQNADAIRYSIVSTTDGMPSILQLQPVSDAKLTESALLPTKVAISDDYGFSSLKLKYRLLFSNYAPPMENYKEIEIPLISPELAMEVPYVWNLNDMDIADDDVFEYFFEVSDNDIISGPKTARTQPLKIKMPSLNEMLSETDRDQKKLEEDVAKALKKSQDIKKDMQELNREILKNPTKREMNWKEKKMAENIQKKQEDLQKDLDQIQKNMEKMSEKMQQNKTMSPETLEKFKELQNLMKEVNSPMLQKAQQKMQKALEQVNPEKVQEAMKNAEMDEERFRKSIERTMKILKRLKAEQKVDALTKRAEELAKKQDELAEKSQNSNADNQAKRDEMAKHQEQLQKELNDIAKEMKELQDLMKELGEDMPMEEMEKAMEAMQKEDVNKQMQEAKQDIKRGQMQQARKKQKKAANTMKQYANQMEQLKKKMNEKLMKEIKRKMKKAISDMLDLSAQQETLKNKTESTDYNSTQYPNMASQQARMTESMLNTTSEIAKLADKTFAVTPQMGRNLSNAIKSMQEATQELSERNSRKAGQQQGTAMSSINMATIQMQNMLGQMEGSGSCSNPGGSGEKGTGSGEGFMEQLQQMAAQQQAINQAMQQIQSGGSKGMSPEQQANMQRLAGEQARLRKSMEELARESEMGGNKPGGNRNAGELKKIANEMKDAAAEMRSGNISPQTLRRQEQILSRLLDAPRSVHERDQEKKRESETGKNVLRDSPSDIDLSTQEGKAKAMRELLRSIKQGYTKDYEIIIKNYFEAMQNTESNSGKQTNVGR